MPFIVEIIHGILSKDFPADTGVVIVHGSIFHWDRPSITTSSSTTSSSSTTTSTTSSSTSSSTTTTYVNIPSFVFIDPERFVSFIELTRQKTFIDPEKNVIFKTVRTNEMHKTNKYPTERFLIGIDFTNRLTTGEEIVIGNSSVVAYKRGSVEAPDDLLTGGLVLEGNILSHKIDNGFASDIKYQIHFKAVTSHNSLYESVVEITML